VAVGQNNLLMYQPTLLQHTMFLMKLLLRHNFNRMMVIPKIVFRLIVFYAFTVSGLVSCTLKDSYPNTIQWDDDPKAIPVEVLTGIAIHLEPLVGIRRAKVLDSLLIIHGDIKSNQFKVHIYNLNNGEIINSFGSEGRGPEEFGSAIELQVNRINNEVIISDFNMRLARIYDLASIVADRTPEPKKVISMGEIKGYGISILDENHILCETILSKIAPAEETYQMLYKYRLTDSCIVSEASYPARAFARESITLNVHFEYVYKYSLAIRPDKKSIVAVYAFTDLIDIFDSDLKLTGRIQGPDKISPSFEQVGDNINIKPKPNSRYCFDIPIAGQSEFWVHYSGQLFPTDPPRRRIYVFSWNGKAKRCFRFDKETIVFDVDFEKRIGYGLDPKNGELYKYNY